MKNVDLRHWSHSEEDALRCGLNDDEEDDNDATET